MSKSKLRAKSASIDPNGFRTKLSNRMHKIVDIATRPEFGRYGKNLKTADDVIAYYGHGLANLIGKTKKKEKTPFRYKSAEKGTGEYSKTFKKAKKSLPALPAPEKRKLLTGPKAQKILPAPKKEKMLTGPKPMKALPAPVPKQKMLTGPKPMKALPAPVPKQKMLTGPKPMKALPAPLSKSTAVGKPLPMQKRLPSSGEKLVGSGSTLAARTQGMSKPLKALPAPKKLLPKLENALMNSYKERLLETIK